MTGDDTVRLTYAELAEARGITIDSARRMTVRHRWPKQIGNDGLTRIDVPASALTGAGTGAREDAGSDASTDAGETSEAVLTNGRLVTAIVEGVTAATGATTDALLAAAIGDTRRAIVALEETVAALRMQLVNERERADRAEAKAQEARAVLDEQSAEHRRVVEALVARIPPPRRRWWAWGRRA